MKFSSGQRSIIQMSAIDTYRHKGMRSQLVELLRSKGISDERVLHAIEQVPRHVLIKPLLSMPMKTKLSRSGQVRPSASPIR